MSFDAFLTLLFILLFVVGPLIRRMTGGGQARPPGSPPAGGPTAPGRQPRPRTAEPFPEGEHTGESDLERRLEEARRRVQEAMGERSAGGAPARPSGPVVAPAAPQALDWQPSPKAVQPFIQAREARTRPRRSSRPDGDADVSAEQRRGTRRTARLRAEGGRARERVGTGRGPAVDRDGIVAGMIWHEILSDPVSKRGTRRMSSRLR